MDIVRLKWQGGSTIMRRSRRLGLFLGAILASTGCEPHSSWLRHKDEDELPPRSSGIKAVDSDTSKILGVDSDDKKATPFFKSDRRVGGLSSEAQDIERNLGAY
jgi:hypothetical protein